MSAIICCCSLSAPAHAGVAAAANIATAVTTARHVAFVNRRMMRLMAPSLSGDDEMRAPVLRPRGFVVTSVERELLAVTDDLHLARRNAKRDEVRARGHRPAFAQR